MKLITILGTFCLILLFAFLLFLGYLVFWPFRTLEIYNSPAPVRTPIVKAGQDLVYDVNYCRFDFNGAQVYRTLYGVGNITVPTPLVNTVTSPGCRTAHVHLQIPASTPPGKYHMEGLTVIQVNVFRTQYIRFNTQEFTVTQ